MENIIFLNKIYFLLIIPLLLIIIILFYKKNNLVEFTFYKTLKKVYKHSSFFYYVYFLLISLITILYIIILSNPNKINSSENIEKNWVDIVIVFDVSYSMEAKDLSPSRMIVARDVISNFLWSLKQDRVWLIIFSWKPFVWIPLTFDYQFLKEYVSKMTTNTIDQINWNLQWTAIWDAILMWIHVFDEKSLKREKIMVLITDWEANKWLLPTLALKLLKEKNIKTYTIWIGGLDKSHVLVNDIFWNTMKVEIWWVDEELLKKIAKETKGKYYKANSKEIFTQIFDDIAKLEKKKIEVEIKKTYVPVYDFLAYILVFLQLLLVIVWFKKIRI